MWLLTYFLLAMVQSMLCINTLKVIKQWNEMDFVFPTAEAKLEAETKGYYVRGNSFPLDLDVHYSKDGYRSIFITVPRFGPGRPITLGVIDPSSGYPNALMPYPDYEWQNNRLDNCDKLTNAIRTYIDECSRLWVLDNGKIGDSKLCDPQLLAFDINTNQLLYRHRIDPKIIGRERTTLITPIIDVKDPNDGCKNTFVYVGDVDSYAIIVHDVMRNKTWRVDNKLFFPYPSEGTFTIAGESFEFMDGVLAFALSLQKETESDRILYFHSLASNTENIVRTSVLQNASLYENGGVADPRLFQLLEHRRISQTATMDMDRNGILYYGLATPMAVGCWNTATTFHPTNMDIVAQDPITLQFACGIAVVENPHGEEELWVMSNRFQKIMTGTMTTNETNFRIQMGKIDSLLENTVCRYGSQLMDPLDFV